MFELYRAEAERLRDAYVREKLEEMAGESEKLNPPPPVEAPPL